LANSLFTKYIENDNNNIINKVKKLLYIYRKRINTLKFNYFHKYYCISQKLKILIEKNNKYKKVKGNSKHFMFFENINKLKRKLKANVAVRNKTYSKEKANYSNNTSYLIYNINAINDYGGLLNHRPLSNKIIYRRKEPKIRKRNINFNFYQNKSSDISFDKNNDNSFFFMSHNLNKNNLTNNSSLNYFKNKTFVRKENKSYGGNTYDNSNLIINYINEMENYNKLIGKKNNILMNKTKKLSYDKTILDKNSNNSSNNNYIIYKNLCSKKNIFSCKNTPSIIKRPLAKTPDQLLNYENNTHQNIIPRNKYYILNIHHKKRNRNKNIDNKFISKENEKFNRTSDLKKHILKINFNKMKFSNFFDKSKEKNKENKNNNINTEFFKKLNSNNKSNIDEISTAKEESDFYYKNPSLNYYRNNSFLINNLFSSKKNSEYTNSNMRSTKSNNNIFSPILRGRISNKKNLQKIPKSNTSNNKINIDNLSNIRNKNIVKTNLLDNYNNSLSTNYNDKQSSKDIDESGLKSYIKNNTTRNCKKLVSRIYLNQSKKSYFYTNHREQKDSNEIEPKNLKNNIKENSLNYILIDPRKINNNKTFSRTNLDKPSSNKQKSNNHILQNISFSNYSLDKPFSEHKIYNKSKENKSNNSPKANNFYLLNNRKNKNLNNNSHIPSLYTNIKSDKANNNKNENKNNFDCMNIINEYYESKKNDEKENKNSDNENNNDKEKCLETSLESISDSKMYELAKSYIPVNEYLDKTELENILRNKKTINDK